MSVTTYQGEKAVIEARIVASTSVADDHIAWQNADFTPPDGIYIEARINNQQPFAREIPASGGSKSHPGLLTVNVYEAIAGPEGEGPILTVAQEIIDAFEFVTVQGIRFNAPYIPNRGPDPESGRYRVQVDCPYDRITVS